MENINKSLRIRQAGPFLKWAGGKGRLIEQYRNLFPDTLKRRGYVEPFLGSGAVFFHVIQNLKPASCTLLDVNPDLINTWREIRDHVEDVIVQLSGHKACHNAPHITETARRQYYFQVREQVPENAAARAARFIYLNKTCFNGLHRLNSKGEFNVPMGRYKNPSIFSADHLRQVSELLQGVTIETCSFQECGKFINDGDFVYLDPPYAPLSRTSNFASYSAAGFTETHQAELRDFLKTIGARAEWMLSNSVAPLITQLYASPEFYKHRVLAGRAINSVGTKRGKIEECVITSYSRITGTGN